MYSKLNDQFWYTFKGSEGIESDSCIQKIHRFALHFADEMVEAQHLEALRPQALYG